MKHLGVLVLHPSLKIPESDLAALRAAGYVPLRATDAQVVLRTPVMRLDGNAVTLAAIKTVAVNPQRREEFGRLIMDSVLAQLGWALSADGKLTTRIR